MRTRLFGPLDLDARLLQLAAVPLLELERAEPVHQHAHLDARARALHEGVEELSPDLVGLQDVDLEVDRVPRAPDGLEHRRIEAVAVLEQLDLAAAGDRRVEEGADRRDELLGPRRRQLAQGEFGLLPVGKEEGAEHRDQRDEPDGHQGPAVPRERRVEERAHPASSGRRSARCASSGWWSEPNTVGPRSRGCSSRRSTCAPANRRPASRTSR
jgi:hypothetical protein